MDMHLTPDVAAFHAVLARLSPDDRARVDAAAGLAAQKAAEAARIAKAEAEAASRKLVAAANGGEGEN